MCSGTPKTLANWQAGPVGPRTLWLEEEGGNVFSAGKSMPCGRRLPCIIWHIRSGNLSKFPFSCRQAGHPQALGPKNRTHLFPNFLSWREKWGAGGGWQVAQASVTPVLRLSAGAGPSISQSPDLGPQ